MSTYPSTTEAAEVDDFEGWIRHRSNPGDQHRRYDLTRVTADDGHWIGVYLSDYTQIAWEAWCHRANPFGE